MVFLTLLVILYIIGNLCLPINSKVDIDSDRSSLGSIDDFTHLVANKDVDMNVLDLEEEVIKRSYGGANMGPSSIRRRHG